MRPSRARGRSRPSHRRRPKPSATCSSPPSSAQTVRGVYHRPALRRSSRDSAFLTNAASTCCFVFAVAQHQPLLARLNARAAATASLNAGASVSGGGAGGSFGQGGLSRDCFEDRTLSVCFLLHTADLCNALLPPDLSQRMVARLVAEFAAQSEAERSQGLPVSVAVAPAEGGLRARSEASFVDFVIQPCVAALVGLALQLAPLLDRVADNRACWVELAASSAAEAARLERQGSGSSGSGEGRRASGDARRGSSDGRRASLDASFRRRSVDAKRALSPLVEPLPPPPSSGPPSTTRLEEAGGPDGDTDSAQSAFPEALATIPMSP